MERTERDFRELKLDSQNPRLPDEYRNLNQKDLLRHFFSSYALEELASSYIANGFFPSEPLLILKDGTVLEGNRRLAALKFLFHDETAQEADIPEYSTDEDFSSAKKKALQTIPVIIVDDREELSAYLGYRHISGPKAWSAAAKARYVTLRVNKHAQSNPLTAFSVVGKEIGSNVPGVRNMYQQYSLLKIARDDLGLYKEATMVMEERFGVWARLTNSQQVFKYIGYCPKDKTLSSINEALQSLDENNFRSLLNDLIPQPGEDTALLNDSRRATEYTRILGNSEALETLRSTRNYSIALLVADGSPINRQLQDVDLRLEKIYDRILDGIFLDDTSHRSIKRIYGRVIAIKSAAEEAIANIREDNVDAEDEQ